MRLDADSMCTTSSERTMARSPRSYGRHWRHRPIAVYMLVRPLVPCPTGRGAAVPLLAGGASGLGAVEPDLDWQDLAVRKDHLWDLVDLAAEVLATAATDAEAMADPEVAEAAGLLAEVVLQDVVDNGTGPEIADGVARDRIVSHPIRRCAMAANRRRGASTVTSST